MMVRTSSWMGALVLVLLSAGSANARATAEGNLKKGFIQCGVNTGLAGFSQPAGDTYLRALAVGLLNTFRVATTDMVRHPAPSATDCDPVLGQYVYRLFQGHLPRRDHRALRFFDDDQGFPR